MGKFTSVQCTHLLYTKNNDGSPGLRRLIQAYLPSVLAVDGRERVNRSRQPLIAASDQ
jgi:hypothetical protein